MFHVAVIIDGLYQMTSLDFISEEIWVGLLFVCLSYCAHQREVNVKFHGGEKRKEDAIVNDNDYECNERRFY